MCRSQQSCQICRKRHHTSICEREATEQMKVATGGGKVIYPVVVVEANGIKCCALLDTGAGSSYASTALLERLNSRPVRKECKRIEMMMEACNRRIEVHQLTISNLKGDFKIKTEVTKVVRPKLHALETPQYQQKINQFPHLKGITMDDMDSKPELPVHIVLGASEYAQIKTVVKQRVGLPGEPVAECTQFGWTMMSPGKEVDLNSMFLTQTSSLEYENLCKLDVLGLEDSSTNNQDNVYEEFREQLTRSSEDGTKQDYHGKQTNLLWPTTKLVV